MSYLWRYLKERLQVLYCRPPLYVPSYCKGTHSALFHITLSHLPSKLSGQRVTKSTNFTTIWKNTSRAIFWLKFCFPNIIFMEISQGTLLSSVLPPSAESSFPLYMHFQRAVSYYPVPFPFKIMERNIHINQLISPPFERVRPGLLYGSNSVS